MLSFTLAFLSGDLYLQFLPQLPSQPWLLLILFSNLLLCWYLRSRIQLISIIIAFSVGFSFSAGYAHYLLSWSLPKNAEEETLKISGYIASLPITNKWGKRFLFSMNKIQDKNLAHQPLLSLSWRVKENTQPIIRAGQKWQLFVRLKRIHGVGNQGSFDYEAWALQRGIRANGYVVVKANNHRISSHWYVYPILRLREYLYDQLKNNLPHSNSAPWLVALIIGEKNNILEKDWQVLRYTGTNHLMAIAGLHIGLLAGWIHAVVTFLWRRSIGLTLFFPAKEAGMCAAFVVAILYSAMAGFSLPTQRALIMLTILSLALLKRRKLSGWHGWSFALLVVLILNPLSVLTESFWLSFGTIALILYGMSGRLTPKGIWWKWGRAQWVIGIGLIPVTLALFQECSLISLFANTIAIPFLGFLILPFCFLSSIFLLISASVGSWFLLIADFNLSILWKILTWFSKLPIATLHYAMPNSFVLLTSIVAVILLLLPAGMPGRLLSIIWFLPLILFKPQQPKEGEVWLSVLDVAQGLSVIVQTHKHLLIYDAGPKWDPQSDTGARIVLPYLRTINAKKLDSLVISHGDNDHIGGADSLLHVFPATRIISSVPEKFNLANTTYCIAGENWVWDQIHFSFLYPGINELHKTNDSSCVLRIDTGKHVILLTGDIEKYAENRLSQQNVSLLSADILVAPHHGSKTSALKQFVQAVHPKIVIYSTGYKNKYHFPHQSVIAKYHQIQALQLNTAETGGISFKLKKTDSTLSPESYRVANVHYWHEN